MPLVLATSRIEFDAQGHGTFCYTSMTLKCIVITMVSVLIYITIFILIFQVPLHLSIIWFVLIIYEAQVWHKQFINDVIIRYTVDKLSK